MHARKIFIDVLALVSMLAIVVWAAQDSRADPYIVLSAGQSHYEQDIVWTGKLEGYDDNITQPSSYSIGIGYQWKYIGLEIAYHNLGEYSQRSLFGNPDDPGHGYYDYQTIAADQTGSVTAGSLIVMPRYPMGDVSLYGIAGVTYYNAKWDVAYVRLDGSEEYAHGKNRIVSMSTHSIGYVYGAGVSYQIGSSSIAIEYRDYPGMSVDGSDFSGSWSGGGGYKSVSTINVTARVAL